MKLRLFCSLTTLLFLVIVTVAPVSAQVLYDNGAINGNTDAWTINSGFVVSNSFILSPMPPPCCHYEPNAFAFGAWLFPGDVLQSAEVSITDAEFGGTTFFDGVVNFTQSGCTSNGFGFDVCTETGNLPSGINLGVGGTFWLNLQNATTNTGDPVYWDENSGPSMASENSVGTIPSESFTIFGNVVGGSTPEPTSIVFFGTAVGVFAAFARRRLKL